MITITITTLSSSFGIWIAKSLHYYNSDKVTTNCGHVRYLQKLAMLLQRCLVAYAAGARKKRIAITCRRHRLLTEAVAQCDVVHVACSTCTAICHVPPQRLVTGSTTCLCCCKCALYLLEKPDAYSHIGACCSKHAL